MARYVQLSIAAVVLAASSTSFAQMVHMVPAGAGGVSTATLGPVTAAAWWNGWGANNWGYHSSTPYEGWARGNAAILRGWGEFNYLTSLANVNNQDAYEHFLQNDRMRVEVYFAKKQTWDSWRATQRQARPTPEQLARWADQQRPDRLAATQINAETGKIAWPTLLTAPEYAEARAQLDGLFALRAKGMSQPHFVADVKAAIGNLRTTLLNEMEAIPAMEYISVDKFLDSLHYESYFLPDRVAMAE